MYGALTASEKELEKKEIRERELVSEIIDLQKQQQQLVARILEYRRTNHCHLLTKEIDDLNDICVKLIELIDELNDV